MTAGVAAAYFAAARLGLSMAFVADQVTVIWPPTGIALAAVLLFGRRAAAGVWSGAFAANATIGEPIGVAVGIATGNTLGALLGVWLLQRAGFSRRLERLWDVMALMGLAGAAAAAASATSGVATLCAGGLQPWTTFGSLWWLWWLGDLMGVVLIAPLLLTASARAQWARMRAAEVTLLFAGLAAVAVVLFAGSIPGLRNTQPLAYGVFPFVIWAALRFRQRETAAAILLIAGIAVWGTVRGHGPFVGGSVHESLVMLQLFMAVVAGTGLVLAAAIAERRTAERRRAADYAVAQILADSPTLEAAAPRILQTICECLAWDLGGLWTFDESGLLRCREMWHKPQVSAPHFLQASRDRTFERGVGLPGRVWAAGQPLWFADMVGDPNLPRAPVATAEGLHAAFGFPIRLGGEVLGVVEFFSRDIRQPDADLLQMFATVGGQIGQFLDRRRAEEDRLQLLAELRRAGQAKDQFLAVLGHELRNPLAPMRNALEVMRGRGFSDALARRMGEVLERQLRHMVRLVDDLLDVSRITRGRIELRRERVDFAAVVASVVEAVKPLFDERRHQLSVSLPDTPLPLDADPTRLEQVVANLLHNAARYTDSGGRIALRVVREGGEAVLHVADTGIGLRPEMLERIFEPFTQAERTAQRPSEGLGIGLTLVRSLVTLHRGSVSAASAGPGQGSEFTVRLPLAAGKPGRDDASAAFPTLAAPVGRPKRVLVVDDNVDGAESMALVLRQGGHHALTAYDGRAALEQARLAAFDVVLLDIGLPDGLDGYEVARRLRSADTASAAVLIALTGFGQEQDHRRSRDAGFAHHLVKPVDPAELQRIIDRL